MNANNGSKYQAGRMVHYPAAVAAVEAEARKAHEDAMIAFRQETA